jgi:hypothetical protein
MTKLVLVSNGNCSGWTMVSRGGEEERVAGHADRKVEVE